MKIIGCTWAAIGKETVSAKELEKEVLQIFETTL